MLIGVLLLTGWLCTALLIGLTAGVTRVDLLLVVPATVMVVCLVTPGASLLALALTSWLSSPGGRSPELS